MDRYQPQVWIEVAKPHLEKDNIKTLDHGFQITSGLSSCLASIISSAGSETYTVPPWAWKLVESIRSFIAGNACEIEERGEHID